MNLAKNELCGLDEDGDGTYTTEGIEAIADALKGNASLSRLDVSYNKLHKGGNGVQLLRDAVREREGFVLIDGEEAEMDESSAYTSDEDDRYTSD